MNFFAGFADELLKCAQVPFEATAAGRVQASQKAMGTFQKQLQGNKSLMNGAQPKPSTMAPSVGKPAVPALAPASKPAGIPGAKPAGSAFGKQTAKGLGIPGANPF